MRTETLYHGSHRGEMVLHEGLCLTDEVEVAERYAGWMPGGAVTEAEVALSGLTVMDVPGYDHDEAECPADDSEYRAARAAEGADVLRYEDEDIHGRPHTCYRLVSAAALAAVVRSEVLVDEDELVAA